MYRNEILRTMRPYVRRACINGIVAFPMRIFWMCIVIIATVHARYNVARIDRWNFATVRVTCRPIRQTGSSATWTVWSAWIAITKISRWLLPNGHDVVVARDSSVIVCPPALRWTLPLCTTVRIISMDSIVQFRKLKSASLSYPLSVTNAIWWEENWIWWVSTYICI